MRVRHTVNPIISDDAEGKDLLFGLDAEKAEVSTDAFSKYTSGRFSIAGGANENISFGDVADVRGVFVKADGDFNARFNGSADALEIKRASAATGSTARMFLEIDASALNIANPGTAVLNGIWCVYGDLAA